MQMRPETVPMTGRPSHSRLNHFLSASAALFCFSIILASQPCSSASVILGLFHCVFLFLLFMATLIITNIC